MKVIIPRTTQVYFHLRLARDTAIVKVTRRLLKTLHHLTRRGHRNLRTLVAIDAGEIGWSLIEYQELHQSALEYLGEDGVVRVVIQDRDRHFRELRQALAKHPVTHCVFDPRSLSDHPVRSWCQALGVALWSTSRGIVPIARLTDVQVRRWRLQTAVVTARAGTCSILMDPARAQTVCAHRSLVGPLPMALSRSTFTSVSQLSNSTSMTEHSVEFTGALYEPRTTFLTALKDLLLERGVRLKTRSRALGAPRASNDQYWRDLANSGVVVSTSHMSVMRGQDNLRDTHFVYRFIEALAVGRPLVCTPVHGAEHLLEPGRHFLPGVDPDSACEAVLSLLNDSELRERISSEGQRRVQELVEQNYFWREVDRTLNWALTKPQREERPPSTTML